MLAPSKLHSHVTVGGPDTTCILSAVGGELVHQIWLLPDNQGLYVIRLRGVPPPKSPYPWLRGWPSLRARRSRAGAMEWVIGRLD